MVLNLPNLPNLPAKPPLPNLKVTKVVVLSGLLTFMYCIEFCIGLRTVYQVFKIWSYPIEGRISVHWTLCAACLLTAIISTFAVNVLSALWEQRQLQERKKEKSSIRFTIHVIMGGMIYRYFTLWFINKKESQRRGALLLTMIKFFFTQVYTIPMLIVHISVVEQFSDLGLDFCSVLCISINLILTCTMFDWCSKEVEEIKKWDYETVDLVPLIFQSDPTVSAGEIPKIGNNSISKEISKKEKEAAGNKNVDNDKEFEEVVLKTIVFFQTFGFSFGRLLALGILLKLAGIYAVSIMFLQLLISVIYLKFQAPILVSDSLPKWRQLTRLAFMSYILIFEWHINRDPKTAYDFTSNMKHSIFYYCLATLESVFYLVTWSITTNYASRSELNEVILSDRSRFCRIVLVIGTLFLVFSLAIHVLLLFWHSRRISSFFCSVRRRYENAKLRLSKYGLGKNKNKMPEKPSKLSHVDIGNPIMVKKADGEMNQVCMLEKKNSYRDLREPVDEEIEIYFRKCDNKNKKNKKNKNKNKNNDKTANEVRRISIPDDVDVIPQYSTVVETTDYVLQNEFNKLQSNCAANLENVKISSTISPEEEKSELDKKIKKEIEELSTEIKISKLTAISGSITERWGKVSSASRKFTGAMKGQIQKRKEQFQNFRSSPVSKRSEASHKSEYPPESPDVDEIPPSTIPTLEECVGAPEGYFVEDAPCNDEESFQPEQSIDEDYEDSSDSLPQVIVEREIDEDYSEPPSEPPPPLPPMDENHEEGDLACSCYICRSLSDGRFHRRRSSSLPPVDRKAMQEQSTQESNFTLPRYMSSPNISEKRCAKKSPERKPDEDETSPPSTLPKAIFSFNTLSQENRIEHYV